MEAVPHDACAELLFTWPDIFSKVKEGFLRRRAQVLQDIDCTTGYAVGAPG